MYHDSTELVAIPKMATASSAFREQPVLHMPLTCSNTTETTLTIPHTMRTSQA